MKRSKNNRKLRKKMNWWLFPSVLIIAFAISTGTSYFYLKDKFAFDSAFIADIEARQDTAVNKRQKEGHRRLYGADKQDPDGEESIVIRKDTLLVVAEDIIRNYVKPFKVRLLDLYMDKKGVIYIDFGDELKRNINVDASEELKIVAGLYNGMKETIPGFTALKILIGGSEAQSIGGHIDISKPIGEEIASGI